MVKLHMTRCLQHGHHQLSNKQERMRERPFTKHLRMTPSRRRHNARARKQ